MSFIDDLVNALARTQGLLSALGPEPAGDPAGMRQLAAALRAEATNAAAMGKADAGLPDAMTFIGPAGDDFRGNTALVGAALAGSAGRLQDIAGEVEREAAKIQRAQEQWHADRQRFQEAIHSIESQIRGAG